MSTDNDKMALDNYNRQGVVKNIGQFQRHSTFWYSDGSIVHDKTIYNVHITMVQKLSEIFNRTEAYPLFLPGTTVSEFDDLLQWIYRAEWQALGNDDIERERIFKVLDGIPLPPSRRIQLGGRFSINKWINSGVADIFTSRVTQLQEVDVQAMGWPVYMILVKAQEKIDDEARRTAFVPPAMSNDPSWQCSNHSACLRTWPKIWFDKIGRRSCIPIDRSC
ncbi:hypothetical protein R3P38DRAFT_3204025 [Favolaschia claudopus]|uniref:BTB domain-containing protein n=1 Tax=Favolaschia claudopus TaxID=2862362 RepID=A0AAW0AS01_9AGAR